MKRSKKIEPGIITNHKHKARNTIKRISEAENSNKSPLIIPRVIRTVSCYGDLPSTSSVPPSLSLDQDERALVSKTTQNYDKKIRQAKNQSEIVFLNKAMDFLTGIEILTTTQESLVQRIPSSAESDNDAYSDDFT